MRPASAKAKGRKFQQFVAKKISSFFDLPEEDVVSRPMGSGGSDLIMSNRARAVFPVDVEAKCTKAFPSLAALDQARYNAPEGMTPAVCWHAPRSPYERTIIYFELADFLVLMKRLRDEQ